MLLAIYKILSSNILRVLCHSPKITASIKDLKNWVLTL